MSLLFVAPELSFISGIEHGLNYQFAQWINDFQPFVVFSKVLGADQKHTGRCPSKSQWLKQNPTISMSGSVVWARCGTLVFSWPCFWPFVLLCYHCNFQLFCCFQNESVGSFIGWVHSSCKSPWFWWYICLPVSSGAACIWRDNFQGGREAIAKVLAPGSVWGLGPIVFAQATAAIPGHPEGDKQTDCLCRLKKRMYWQGGFFGCRKCEEAESKHIKLFLSVLNGHLDVQSAF